MSQSHATASGTPSSTHESEHDDELWFVQLGGGAVRAMNLDELDEAFQRGAIDESSLVRRDGAAHWMRLCDLLAGSADTMPAPIEVEPMAPSTATATAATTRDAHGLDEGPRSVVPLSLPPPATVSEIADLEDDLPAFAPRRRARSIVLGAVALVGVLGAAGFTAARVSGRGFGGRELTASLGGASAAGPVHPAANPAAPAPAKASEAGGAVNEQTLGFVAADVFVDGGARINDEQRRLLLEADKKRQAEADAKRAAHAARHHSSRPVKMGNPIQKGGAKYDPLNGEL